MDNILETLGLDEDNFQPTYKVTIVDETATFETETNNYDKYCDWFDFPIQGGNGEMMESEPLQGGFSCDKKYVEEAKRIMEERGYTEILIN